MNGCMTCGGFGGHHDPVAHDADLQEIEEPTPCELGNHTFCIEPLCSCPCHSDDRP